MLKLTCDHKARVRFKKVACVNLQPGCKGGFSVTSGIVKWIFPDRFPSSLYLLLSALLNLLFFPFLSSFNHQSSSSFLTLLKFKFTSLIFKGVRSG
jgi:hypothetical protein